MNKFRLFITLIIVATCLSSCETAKRVYLGVGKTEVTVKPTNEVIKYYEPFLSGYMYKTKLYVMSNYEGASTALKDFSFPRIFIKSRQTNTVYELNCFEDIKANIDDMNNNIFNDYITLKNHQEFDNLISFLNSKSDSKLILYSGNEDTTKKWDVYIAYATFLGTKLRKMTIPVTKLKDINEFYLLDFSIDENAIKIEP